MLSKLKLLLKYTSQYKWWYIVGIISLTITVWVSLEIPKYIEYTIDIIAKQQPESRFILKNNIITIIVLSVFLIITRSLSRILIFVPARLIERQIKGDMFLKLSSFGKKYYDENSTGAIISRINNDINGIRMITGFGILQIVNIALSLSLTPYMMWVLSPSLTLYCVIPIIIIFFIVRFGMNIMVKYTHLQMNTLQSLSGNTISFLSGNNVIKSYNIYNYAEEKIESDNIKLFGQAMKIAWIRSFVMPLLQNLSQILKVLILFVGGLYVAYGQLSIGQLTAYIAYSALLTQPIMSLGWVLTVMQQGMVGIESIQTILSREGEDENRISTDNSKNLFHKGIFVKNLSYKFHDNQQESLQNISFEIKPNTVIGVTGAVGSGKSTLINCLNGYLRPEEGMIFFDNIDANSLKTKDIRNSVRTVSQEVFLFSDTIENNIIFGAEKSEITNNFDQTIFRAALKDEISRFKDNKNTLVGEKGIMLSGGQKQRISLARALYTPCDLLILDDVFSAVDTDTERFLIKHIVENNMAKSLLIVSNRISVLQKTDYSIVLEDGKITAIGSHSELMENSDFYRKISKLQNQ